MAGVAHDKGDLVTTRMALNVALDALRVEEKLNDQWKKEGKE